MNGLRSIVNSGRVVIEKSVDIPGGAVLGDEASPEDEGDDLTDEERERFQTAMDLCRGEACLDERHSVLVSGQYRV